MILEEKRSRNNAQWRISEQAKPYLYGDTKYATTTIIGSEENLKTFKPESLTSFYHTWYRPDLQALIVVGDIDVDEVEAKIKSTFADIPATVNPKAKDVIEIPQNEGAHSRNTHRPRGDFGVLRGILEVTAHSQRVPEHPARPHGRPRGGHRGHRDERASR